MKLFLDNATITMSEDFIINNYWQVDGKIPLPVDMSRICSAMGIQIFSMPELERYHGRKSLNNLKDKIIFLDSNLCGPEKDLWQYQLHLAFETQFMVRKISTMTDTVPDDTYANGWKLARHVLMPSEVMIRFATGSAEHKDEILRSMVKSQSSESTEGGGYIPEEEFFLRIEKLKKKLSLK